jgi:predicted branched-subunit amino acid permease
MSSIWTSLKAGTRHRQFRQGAEDAMTLAPGSAAWGLMTGVAMIQSGLSMTEALVMTWLVFAGSSQLAAMPLLALGAPIWVILATAFCVNLRFVVFSLHLRNYVMHLRRPLRLLLGYFIADQSYVLLSRRFPDAADPEILKGEALHEARQARVAYMCGTASVNWSSWQVASMLGVMLAQYLPSSWGLSFAGVLALLGVMCALINSPLRVLSALVAGSAAVAVWALPFQLNILVAIAAAVALASLLEPGQTPSTLQGKPSS